MSFEQLVLRQFPRRARCHLDAADLGAFESRWSILPEQRRSAVRCLHGHLPFGVHGVLPAPVAYVTLLREPVDRVVSAYSYALRRPELPVHRELVSGAVSLHAYATGELSSDVHDAQTRALCGGELPPESGGRGMVERALGQLPASSLVGLRDRFDETALLCRRLFGWRDVHYVERNRNRRRLRLVDVGAPTLAAIRERNPLDCELYALASARFAELLRANPIAPGELRAFRRGNRLYGVARRFCTLPVALMRDARAAAGRARPGS
jgi:hypothetical protein